MRKMVIHKNMYGEIEILTNFKLNCEVYSYNEKLDEYNSEEALLLENKKGYEIYKALSDEPEEEIFIYE